MMKIIHRLNCLVGIHSWIIQKRDASDFIYSSAVEQTHYCKNCGKIRVVTFCCANNAYSIEQVFRDKITEKALKQQLRSASVEELLTHHNRFFRRIGILRQKKE